MGPTTIPIALFSCVSAALGLDFRFEVNDAVGPVTASDCIESSNLCATWRALDKVEMSEEFYEERTH